MTIQNITIVDDSDTQRQFVQSLCRELFTEAEFQCAENGLDGLRKLRNKHSDLVLVDLEMPLMDGVEFISHLANEKLARSVIVMSSRETSLISSVGVMAEDAGLKVLATLQKPISREMLVLAVKNFDPTNVPNIEALTPENHIDHSELLVALKDKQFSLHFQPKLLVNNLLMVGVEALARWQHPEHGFIPPSTFIDIAETSGVVDNLSLFLFDNALKYLGFWQNRGLNLSLSFNLSPLSLNNKDLLVQINTLVQSHKLKPTNICFEITENVMLQDLSTAIQTLARLRLQGYGISIDDYGSGFANAEQLARMPANELKIDRSLVDSVSTREQKYKILKSTVELARELNLTTVAEGVENSDDYECLRTLGVDQVQGYYFARPMPGEDLPQWVSSDLKKLRNTHQTVLNKSSKF